MIKLTLQCLFSPRLYKIYGLADAYNPSSLEKYANQIITSAQTIFNITLYCSPFICMYISKRGLLTYDESVFYMKAFSSIGSLLVLSFIIRGIGRACNPQYVEFINDYTKPTVDTPSYLQDLRKYDFDFDAWPATFSMPQILSSTWIENKPFGKCAHPHMTVIKRTTIQLLAYIATHTFALRLIYPGSLGFIYNMLWPHLFEGRTQLVEGHGGKRAKIITADGNCIETMFVDQRKEKNPQSRILVICSEGNSGFYEIGIMSTPIKAGYSTLGWNHPGFGGSTGQPFPRQEERAIDAVVQYAIHDLGFDVENIVMFGWSIGGYCSAWAAVHYPRIRGLIMDASFDDLLPLAKNQMPKSWSLLVEEVVRSFVDLNIADLLEKYDGPVHLVRRTEDEIISLRPAQLASNRCNNLLLKIIESRHPEYTAATGNQATYDLFLRYVILSDQQRIVMMRGDLREEDKNVMKMISKYMRDYRSTHCTPLPEEHFAAIMEDL
ncbi:phosphatidylserine lipase ABHD16A [Aricia agestis]|uniref:phosphatidylserine lipase ABHD16A n=1 Tax=Aricia agestis TaxID=91739 RepID=UPI001C20B0FE|nr:phosphatidylserine lipase ABHD16A [Aricia agestis]